MLRVLDVATGEQVDGPIDRARYSPVAWLPGGEAFYYVRRLDPAGCPRTSGSTTAGSGCTGSAPTPPTTPRSSARASTSGRYYGVSVSLRRPLAARSRLRRAPPPATTCGSPTSTAPTRPLLRCASRSRARRPHQRQLRPRRAALRRHRPGRPARPARRHRPRRPGARTWRDLLPAAPGGRARGLRRARRRRTRRPAAAARLVDPARRLRGDVHDLATGAPLDGDGAVAAARASARSAGSSARPEGGHEAWFTYTDHTTPAARATATTGATASLSLFSSPPGVVEVRRSSRQQVAYTSAGRHDRPDVRARPRGRRAGRPAPGDPLRLRRLRRLADARRTPRASSPGSRPAASTRSPTCAAAARRARPGTATGCSAHKQNVFDDFHAAAERLVAEGWTTPASSPSAAAPTAGCWSAPR